MVAGDTTLGHALLSEGRTTSSKWYPKVTLAIADDLLLIDIVEAGFDAGVRYQEHLPKEKIASTWSCSYFGPSDAKVRAGPRGRDLFQIGRAHV